MRARKRVENKYLSARMAGAMLIHFFVHLHVLRFREGIQSVPLSLARKIAHV